MRGDVSGRLARLFMFPIKRRLVGGYAGRQEADDDDDDDGGEGEDESQI